MPPVWIETTISAGERPKINVLDRAATGTGSDIIPSGGLFVYSGTLELLSWFIVVNLGVVRDECGEISM
jgi:hypothetical protein